MARRLTLATQPTRIGPVEIDRLGALFAEEFKRQIAKRRR
jgi:hypothetical protein